MPLYYFDVTDDDGLHRDDLGVELDSFDDARAQAQALLPALAREQFPKGDYHIIRCDVRDASGSVVYWGSLTYRGERETGADGPLPEPTHR